jgi:type I restriction-modification system DNA methylase subunit
VIYGVKSLRAQIKHFEKVAAEAESRRIAINSAANRELALLAATADELEATLSDPGRTRTVLQVVASSELAANDFDLNVPRYVDTAPPDRLIPLEQAFSDFMAVAKELDQRRDSLLRILRRSVNSVAAKE